MRQADGALDLRVGHIAGHREADVDRHDAVRVFLGSLEMVRLRLAAAAAFLMFLRAALRCLPLAMCASGSC